MATNAHDVEDDEGLNQGDVVCTRKITRWIAGPHYAWTTEFSAAKGQHLVFLYLGWQPKDGSKPLDAVQALKNMGWTPPQQIEEAHQNKLAAIAAAEVAK